MLSTLLTLQLIPQPGTAWKSVLYPRVSVPSSCVSKRAGEGKGEGSGRSQGRKEEVRANIGLKCTMSSMSSASVLSPDSGLVVNLNQANQATS